MALNESALSELLGALRAADGVDLVHELAQWALQELIEAEATERIGAARYERTGDRVAERNGHRPRTLSTKAGDLWLAIPKLRQGSFFPSLLEPRRRIDQALYAVVMEAYVSGVSTRSVDALVESMGAASGISKSEVSRICAGLDERVTAFRNRTLGHTTFPYVYLDAIYVHVRDDALGQVVSRAVVVAIGINAQGGREVLGIDVGDSEAETFWTGFLRSLKTRGLSGVRLVISDAHEGLRAAIRRWPCGAPWPLTRPRHQRVRGRRAGARVHPTCRPEPEDLSDRRANHPPHRHREHNGSGNESRNPSAGPEPSLGAANSATEAETETGPGSRSPPLSITLVRISTLDHQAALA